MEAIGEAEDSLNELCAHLAQFPLPIITGIGHERDESIADMVANIKLKTPTSVAEYILARMIQFDSNINLIIDRISNQIQSIVHEQKISLVILTYALLLPARQALAFSNQSWYKI